MRTAKMNIQAGYYNPDFGRIEKLLYLKWAQYPLNGEFIDLRKLVIYLTNKFPGQWIYVTFWHYKTGSVIGKDKFHSIYKQSLNITYDRITHGIGKSKRN